LLNNYHELLGMLEKIEIGKLGSVNIALKKLDEVTDSFLESYDDDKNDTINASELIENRAKLAKDLSKDEEESNQLNDIIKAIKELEDKVNKYRQGATDQASIEEKRKVRRKVEKQLEDNQKDTAINLEENERGGLTEKENPQEQGSTQTQIQISPK
jgi:hypothetical protein